MRALLPDGPRWLSLTIGLAAIVIGALLTLKPFDSLDALTIFIGASLFLAGLGELLSSRDTHTPRMTGRIGGGLLMLTGVVALALRDQTIRAVAITVGIGLLVSGVPRLWGALRGRSETRYISMIGGLARIILGMLALLWPDVTILVVAILVGPVAVILGVDQVIQAIRGSTPRIAAQAQQERPPGLLRRGLAVARVTAALVLALSLVAASAYLHRGSSEVEAFYRAPDDLPDTPGQLIRAEAFDRGLPDNARAVRILFTTTAIDGGIGVASGIVVIPTAEASEPLPVLLWEHGTTGVDESCAPSLLQDPFGAGAMPARQEVIDHGWAIVAPDYIGLGTEGPHPYLIGIPTARSSIDAVRAARQVEGVNLSDQTVVWGHSQGGAAALWVGIEARTYAPDVPLLGVAAMAPASDLPNLAKGAQENPVGQLFAAFIIWAYSEVYPDVSFNDYVRPSARRVVESMVTRCLSEPATLLSIGTVLLGQNLYSQDPAQGPLGPRLAENVPLGASGVPAFMGQGGSDGIVNPAAQSRFVHRLCEIGQVVEYHTYAGRGHLEIIADDSPMIPDLIAWTTARFAGEPAAEACTTARD